MTRKSEKERKIETFIRKIRVGKNRWERSGGKKEVGRIRQEEMRSFGKKWAGRIGKNENLRVVQKLFFSQKRKNQESFSFDGEQEEV